MTIKELKEASLIEVQPYFSSTLSKNRLSFNAHELDSSPFTFHFNGKQCSISGNIFGTKHISVKNSNEILLKLANPILSSLENPHILKVVLYKFEEPIYIHIGIVKVDDTVLYAFEPSPQ